MGSLKCRINQWSSLVWWNRRSFLERFLCLISFLSLVLCIITVTWLIILTSQMTKPNAQNQKVLSVERNEEHKTCLTPGCIKAAGKILEYIDENVKPCDDFYLFVCGNWLKKTVIPDDRRWYSEWSVLGKEIRRRLKEVIENVQDSAHPYIQNMKNAYDACMNTTEIESLGSEPLNTVLQKLGGWPVVDEDYEVTSQFPDISSPHSDITLAMDPETDENEQSTENEELPNNTSSKSWWWGRRKRNANDFDHSKWIDTLKLIRSMGLTHNIFTSLAVYRDLQNNSRYIIQLDQPNLGLDYTYLLKGQEDPSVSAYYQLMVNSAIKLGARPSVAKNEMKDVLEFEIKLAKFSVPREERRNISLTYTKIKCRELNAFASEIEWKTYLKVLLDNEIQIDDDEVIVVRAPLYLREMSLQLASTNEKIIKNYMIWRVVLSAMRSLDKKWRDLYQNYSSVLTGEIRELDRWMQCLDKFRYKLSIAVGALYATNYLHEDQRNQVSDIAKYVSKAFLKNLDNINWMDETTRRKAKAKAENMIMYISYPDEVRNESKVANLYRNLHLQPMNHFENYMRLNKWYFDYQYSQLREHNTREDWKNWFNIFSVNAYYHPSINALEIPGGILHDFFHSSEKPKYLNYGAIGSVIGHEITHGFDDQGRQYDHVGNNFNWWEEETDKNFKERSQCMIHQYGNYTHEEVGMEVNGINTLGENIADNGAYKVAFWAYKQWIEDNKEELKLPALKYTPTQLYWISAAMVECSKDRPESLKHQILLDSHSPSNFRVIGPLTNSKEFSEEFECPLGSPMNPEKKCIVW